LPAQAIEQGEEIMAKTDETPTTSIDDLFVDTPLTERGTKENEYDPIVKRLAEIIDGGDEKSYPITAPAVDVKKHLRRFQEAAHRADRTGRRVGEIKVDGDTAKVLVTLRPRIIKGGVVDADAETAELDDTDSTVS
jgi:hypothetical protein